MTPLHSTAGPGRRRLAASASEESVPQTRIASASPEVRRPERRAAPHPADPPLYRALLRHWEKAGRTLPGRHDQEWNRIMTTPVWADRPPSVSASPDPRDDGR